jgi:hypothetical protein
VTRRSWFAIALVMLAVACACRRGRDPLPQFPKVVLWAWERPEYMDFLDPRMAGVAFLARTVSWHEGRITSRPRLQPLRVPNGTAVMAVVRLESDGLPPGNIGAVAREILAVAASPGIQAMQVDFDARRSERDWYAALLQEVRHDMSRSMPLTITALASWCERDGWIERLPLAEAVPMLYRMGPKEPHDASGFRLAFCRTSVGISTDELPASLPAGRRVFVFHPHRWDREAYLRAVRLAEQWR